MLFDCRPKVLHKHCLQFLLGVKMAPRETENNAYAKFWGVKQRTLWYVMVFLEWSIPCDHSLSRKGQNILSHKHKSRKLVHVLTTSLTSCCVPSQKDSLNKRAPKRRKRHRLLLSVTSRRPCWRSRTNTFFSSENSTLFSCKFFEKRFYCFDLQHGRLVMWLQTKN